MTESRKHVQFATALYAPSHDTTLGQYRLIARVGSGGMGEVFLALSSGAAWADKLIVIKRLRSAAAMSGASVALFLDEARLAARLNHPNIVQTFEVGEDDGTYFMAMEFLDGKPVSALMERQEDPQKCFSHALWARILADALTGLHYAHELCDYDGKPLHIVHRDVNPGNIFVTFQGQVKVVDFGIAKATVSTSQTKVGTVRGTARYMAPERAKSEGYDRRTDVFTAGIVLWEAITRVAMFSGESNEILMKLVQEEIPRASTIAPNVDPRLDAIIARALAKEPESRYQTALEMRDELEGYLRASGQTVGAQDVAEQMLQEFGFAREALQEEIREYVERVSKQSLPQQPRVTPTAPDGGVEDAANGPSVRKGSTEGDSRRSSSRQASGAGLTSKLEAELAELAPELSRELGPTEGSGSRRRPVMSDVLRGPLEELAALAPELHASDVAAPAVAHAANLGPAAAPVAYRGRARGEGETATARARFYYMLGGIFVFLALFLLCMRWWG